MVRPCFLVIDREFPGAISTRKLVLETAKYNVLTAYSGLEALHTFKQFPALTGIVLNAELSDIPCAQLVSELKAVRGNVPIITVLSPGADHCKGADYHLESFDPKRLLDVLQKLTPEETAKIELNEEAMARKTPGI